MDKEQKPSLRREAVEWPEEAVKYILSCTRWHSFPSDYSSWSTESFHKPGEAL